MIIDGLQIAGWPTRADVLWLCRHPSHSLQMTMIDGVYVPIIVDARGDGPVIPERAQSDLAEAMATLADAAE